MSYPGRPWERKNGKREFPASGTTSPARRTRSVQEIPRPWERRSNGANGSSSASEITKWRHSVKVGEYVRFPKYNKLTETANWTTGKVLKIQEPNDFNRSIFVHIECDDKFFTVQSMDDLLPAPPDLGGSPMFERVSQARTRRRQMPPAEVPLPESDDEQNPQQAASERRPVAPPRARHQSQGGSGLATQLSSRHSSAHTSAPTSAHNGSGYTSSRPSAYGSGAPSRLSSSATPTPASALTVRIPKPVLVKRGGKSSESSSDTTSSGPAHPRRDEEAYAEGGSSESDDEIEPKVEMTAEMLQAALAIQPQETLQSAEHALKFIPDMDPMQGTGPVTGARVPDAEQWRHSVVVGSTVFLSIAKGFFDPTPIWVSGQITKIEAPKDSGTGTVVTFVHVVNNATGMFTVTSRNCLFPCCRTGLLCTDKIETVVGGHSQEMVPDPTLPVPEQLQQVMKAVFARYARDGAMTVASMEQYMGAIYSYWKPQRRTDCILDILADYGDGAKMDENGFLRCYLNAWNDPECDYAGRDMIRSELRQLGYCLTE